MINVNDFIGLKYGWGCRPGDGSGKTDCFQLVCAVHRRMGLKDYSPFFADKYEQYSEGNLGSTRVARWLLANGQRQRVPAPGSVVLLPVSVGAALGTYIDTVSLLFIGTDSSVVRASLGPVGHIFWMNQ